MTLAWLKLPEAHPVIRGIIAHLSTQQTFTRTDRSKKQGLCLAVGTEAVASCTLSRKMTILFKNTPIQTSRSDSPLATSSSRPHEAG